jgi:hypothetical protein
MTQLTGRTRWIVSFACRHTVGHGVEAVFSAATSAVGELLAFVAARVVAVAFEVADALVFVAWSGFRLETLCWNVQRRFETTFESTLTSEPHQVCQQRKQQLITSGRERKRGTS